MYLTYGTLSLSVGLLLFFVAMLGARNPVAPAWARESILANLITPLIVGLVAVGAIEITQVVMAGVPPTKDMVTASVVIAITVGIYLSMGFRRRLAAYDAAEKSGELIQGDFGNDGTNGSNQPSGNSPRPLREAA